MSGAVLRRCDRGVTAARILAEPTRPDKAAKAPEALREGRRRGAARRVLDRIWVLTFTRGNPLRTVWRSVGRPGVLQTFTAVRDKLDAIAFDLRFGTDTLGRIERDALDVEGEHKMHAGAYEATQARVLRRLIRKLDLPKEGAFVDLGSGKGRALLIAAQLGFARIVGVEFSRRLCEIARENVKAFRQKAQTASRVEIVESDVANYPIGPEDKVFYLYNPFDEVILAKFLSNLRTSVAQFPRKVWLIYNHPIRHEVIDQSHLFCACQEFVVHRAVVRVYST